MATAPTTSPAEDETGYLARLKAMQDVEVERFKTAQKAETERQELINEIMCVNPFPRSHCNPDPFDWGPVTDYLVQTGNVRYLHRLGTY